MTVVFGVFAAMRLVPYIGWIDFKDSIHCISPGAVVRGEIETGDPSALSKIDNMNKQELKSIDFRIDSVDSRFLFSSKARNSWQILFWNLNVLSSHELSGRLKTLPFRKNWQIYSVIIYLSNHIWQFITSDHFDDQLHVLAVKYLWHSARVSQS